MANFGRRVSNYLLGVSAKRIEVEDSQYVIRNSK